MKVEINSANGAYVQNEMNVEKKAATRPQVEKAEVNSKFDSPEKNEKEKVKKVADKMNQELKSMDNTSIEFKIHESNAGGLNKVSIKVVEKESEKVIVEIPSEEAIEFSEKMDEITGMLFDHSR